MPPSDAEQNVENRRSVDQQQVVARTYGASVDDIVNVWRYVSSYIEKQMLKGRGVTVSGLGTFTFAESLSDGAAKVAKKPRPIFLLAEKFAQQHQLDYAKRYVEGKVPVADLNYAAIASDSPFSRDFVDQIVRHVVSEMSRALAGGRNVDFRLDGVGRLTIREKKVKMKFLKDFLAELDPSGRLAAELKNRPNTADSVISRATTARPPTANTLALPSFMDGCLPKGAAMATIREEDDSQQQQQQVKDVPSGVSDNRTSVEWPDSHDDSRERGSHAAADSSEKTGAMKRGDGAETEPRRRASAAGKARGDPAARTPAPLSTAGMVNFDELLLANDAIAAPAAPAAESLPHRPSDVDVSAIDERPSAQPAGSDRIARWAQLEARRAASASVRAPPLPVAAAADRPDADSSGGGGDSGFAHCHVCTRRRDANVRISLSAERLRRDESETKVLHQYLLLKEKEARIKEEELAERKAGEARQTAEFNATVAAAKQAGRAAPPLELPRSYIFHRRPLTPHRSVKQSLLAAALGEQVEHKTAADATSRTREDLLGRLEQIAMAEELARQREQYFQKKSFGHQRYKTALETQMHYKPLPIPASQPDGEVFGKNEPTADEMAERRKHVRALMTDQIEAGAEKKRAHLLQRIHDQQEAEQLLARNRDEIIEDMAKRYELALRQRQTLETDWLLSSHAKRARELEERLRAVSATEHGLVHEQCHKYARCAQCKKRLRNVGESNIWKDDSRYVSGARMMA